MRGTILRERLPEVPLEDSVRLKLMPVPGPCPGPKATVSSAVLWAKCNRYREHLGCPSVTF